MHKSVLLRESIDSLHIQKGKKYIDATLGAGGHTEAIIERGGEVLGIEADPKMLELAKGRVGDRAKLILGNFRDIASIAEANGFEEVSGVLFDLGISSVHLDTDGRGFSFKDPEALLDMRLNPETQGVAAADLLNSLNISQLTELLESKKIAQYVVNFRENKKFEKVGDFLMLFGDKRGKTHPATKAFMMLRIAVNSEYENLRTGLAQAFELLEKGGALVVITFHSGEDKIVKRYFENLKDEGMAELSELVLPQPEEVAQNPRSRSAKMRVLYRT